MSNPIHLTVAAVICQDDRFLLVSEQSADLLVYNQPAGHVEAGEHLTDAMLREAREETGFDIELLGVIGLSTYTSAAAQITYYRVSFAARLMSDQPSHATDPEILGTHWLTYEQLCALANLRSPLVLSDVERFRKGEIYPLALIKEFPMESSHP